MSEYHEFLVNKNGSLSAGAKAVPDIREHISEMRKTAAVFSVIEATDTPSHLVPDVVAEFAGAWPVPEPFDTSDNDRRKFVNPNYAHATMYSDIIIECDCGAHINHSFDDPKAPLQAEHEHTDDCLPQHRLRARARLNEQRLAMMRRLSALGWKGTDIAPRLGHQSISIGDLAEKYHVKMRELYDVYRQRAGHTYTLLVREGDVKGTKLASVYGHAQSTLTRWATKHSEYEPSDDVSRDPENGQFEWEHDTSAQTPDWLKTDD